MIEKKENMLMREWNEDEKEIDKGNWKDERIWMWWKKWKFKEGREWDKYKKEWSKKKDKGYGKKVGSDNVREN